MSTASASKVDMIKEGLPPLAKIHGQSSSKIWWLYQGERETLACPLSSMYGRHSPVLVLVKLACASTRGADCTERNSVEQEKCLEVCICWPRYCGIKDT